MILSSYVGQSFYVQNFTVRWTSALLPPKSEVTLEYRFRPDERLDALDYHLSGWLIYNDSAPTPIIYRSLFVNQTVEIVERRAEWTAQSALAYGLATVGIATAAYVFAQSQGGVGKAVASLTGGKKKSSRRSHVSSGSSDAAASPDASSNSPSSAAAAGWDVKAYRPASVSKAVGKKREQKPVSKK